MAKATTAERGYGSSHRALRDRWAPVVAAGEAECTEPVCVMPSRAILPGTPWELAHDHLTGNYRGPAHRRCNRAERNRRVKRKRRRKFTTSRAW